MLDYAKRANTETRVSVLIEHRRAIENIDEILAVEGLGGAIAAPFDLAVNMGFADGPGHPEVQDAIAYASKKIAAKGFPLASFAVTPEQGQLAMARGARLLFLGFDTMFTPAAVQAQRRRPVTMTCVMKTTSWWASSIAARAGQSATLLMA
jgi:2-keto-3-deoxy-L-rhamnonate aldolase RhmA